MLAALNLTILASALFLNSKQPFNNCCQDALFVYPLSSGTKDVHVQDTYGNGKHGPYFMVDVYMFAIFCHLTFFFSLHIMIILLSFPALV